MSNLYTDAQGRAWGTMADGTRYRTGSNVEPTVPPPGGYEPSLSQAYHNAFPNGIGVGLGSGLASFLKPLLILGVIILGIQLLGVIKRK